VGCCPSTFIVTNGYLDLQKKIQEKSASSLMKIIAMGQRLGIDFVK